MNKSTKQKIGEKYVELPAWLRAIIFNARGFYNGIGWKYSFKRILCWFNRHELSLNLLYGFSKRKVKFYDNQEEKDGSELSFRLQCKHCGYSHKFEAIYRGYDEYRIIEELQYK